MKGKAARAEANHFQVDDEVKVVAARPLESQLQGAAKALRSHSCSANRQAKAGKGRTATHHSRVVVAEAEENLHQTRLAVDAEVEAARHQRCQLLNTDTLQKADSGGRSQSRAARHLKYPLPRPALAGPHSCLVPHLWP